jgi:hypothetical protein
MGALDLFGRAVTALLLACLLGAFIMIWVAVS